MKNGNEKISIDEDRINEARDIIKSKLGQKVQLLIKEVHRSTLVSRDGTISGAYENLFTINQQINKFYCEEKSYTYSDFLTGRIQIK